MSHTDPEILALRALGETAGTAHDAEHAESCAHCRSELARLTEVVRLARDTGPAETLQAPPPQVWDRIAATVGTSPTLNGAVAPAKAPAFPEDGRGSRPAHRRVARPRRRLAGALAALAAGLVIGIGGTIGVDQIVTSPPTRVVARIELSPLPQFPVAGHHGTAVMRATASQREIVVTLRAPARPGFYEVWLLARDGVSMISLGDLSADHTGTFIMPPGVDLRDYSRIDVSLQPFNGSTRHSKASVVRGSLPAAALRAAATARA